MILLILISIPLLNLITWEDKVNSYDQTLKISHSGACNQGLRALVEVIGGF